MNPTYLSLIPFINWPDEERPIDWPARFGRQAPLEVEIGFGNGEFLAKRARSRPECNFIGIELHWESVKRLLRRLAKSEIRNVRVLSGDAPVVMERLFRPGELTRIYSLFPCPWPKDRHEKHRLFDRRFLRLMNSRLIDDGEGQIVTDHEDYFEWINEQLPDTGFHAEWKHVPPVHGTKYEKKWQAGGQDRFFDIRLRKVESINCPLKEDCVLKTHYLTRFDPEAFAPDGIQGVLTVSFKEFLYDPSRKKGMIKAYVGEEDMHQTVWIEIVKGEEDWLIRPSQGCAAIPTKGLQKAIDLVRDGALAAE